MSLFGQEIYQFGAVSGDRFIGDHIGEVVNAEQLLRGLVQARCDVVL